MSVHERRHGNTGVGMTMYDDAELLAVSLTRMAVEETEDAPISAAVHEQVLAWAATEDGAFRLDHVTALVVALARHGSAGLSVVAHYRGVDVAVLLDEFERHKLEQHIEEDDE